MPHILTIAQMEAQKQKAIAEATQRAATKRTNSDQGSMQAQIEAGTNEAFATPDNWDTKNFATVVPAKHLPQQKTISIRRDPSGREFIKVD